MVNISAETFTRNCIHTISQLKSGKELTLWLRVTDIGRELDFENILRANLKLIILQNSKLESIKVMDQNSLKTSNLCMLMNDYNTYNNALQSSNTKIN